MTAQVHQFPEKLDRLADKIKIDLQRREQSESEWVEATLDLCADLAEARAEFPDNISFGHWFDASGFELNKDDRAAAIAMGEDSKRAREVLTVTTRRSLRLICENEFRLRSAAKTTKGNPKPHQHGPATQLALDAIDSLKSAGETVTEGRIAELTGVSAGTANKAVNISRAAAEQALPSLPELSLTTQQKLEVWQKKLEKDFEVRVQEASRERSKQWLDEVRIPIYEQKLAKLVRMLEWPSNAVMTKAEYNIIMKCLHPDGIKSRTEAQLAEAFRIFTKYRPKLASDEETRKAVLHDLPRSRDELLARKKAKL